MRRRLSFTPALGITEKIMSEIIEHDSEFAVFKGDRWTPKLQGDVFCSPACGGGCKKADFDRANEVAKALASMMGHGWAPRVWENLGWHFEVAKGCATICLETSGQYTASIRFSLSDKVESYIAETDSDPRAAMRRVMVDLEGTIARLKRSLDSVSLEPLELQVY
jgi:hypothetical protein